MTTQFNNEGDVLCLICGEVAAEVRLCDDHLNRYHEWKVQIDDPTSHNRVEEFVGRWRLSHVTRHHSECNKGIEPDVPCDCGAESAQAKPTPKRAAFYRDGYSVASPRCGLHLP